MKAPDCVHMDGRACTHRHMDIGRASRYEQVGRQAGLRIPAAIAEQSAFTPDDIHAWQHPRQQTYPFPKKNGRSYSIGFPVDIFGPDLRVHDFLAAVKAVIA